MKTTKISGAELVNGIPQELLDKAGNAGSLLKNKVYRIIGIAKIKPTKAITESWHGVGLERMDTGAKFFVGINTMLGQSILAMYDEELKHGRYQRNVVAEDHPFAAVSDFAASEDEDNNTLFKVTAIAPMTVNAEYVPGTNKKKVEAITDKTKDSPENVKILATKSKNFYKMEIVGKFEGKEESAE